MMATADRITGVLPTGAELRARFRLAHMADLSELESGVYWPRLQPHFLGNKFRRLRYRIIGTASDRPSGKGVLSVRGASGLGELEIAYIADRRPTALVIIESGLPDYCLTSISRGGVLCTGTDAPGTLEVGGSHGLIYRGLPGMQLSATGDHERLAIWIPADALRKRLAALLGGPVGGDIVFEPVFAWTSGLGRSLRRLLWLLTEEQGASHGLLAGNDIACGSFVDLLLHALLRTVPHSHSDRLAASIPAAIPRIVRRAEEYIRAHAAEPIAMHELAAAAGCSVRSLQLGFRRFRETTPGTAILRIRLEAVRRSLASGAAGGTVTEIAMAHGFTHPGRFSRVYRRAFGESPSGALRRAAG